MLLTISNILILSLFFKASKTRNQYLKETKQKKSVPGRKGKRLGGVVKRAMKAEKIGKKQTWFKF